MTDPLEGELLPALRSPPPAVTGPTHRHAICIHVYQGGPPPWTALCGALVHSRADTRRRDLPKCPRCLAMSTDHAQTCGCWKLFPEARLPR
jgi:hypothetical protein